MLASTQHLLRTELSSGDKDLICKGGCLRQHCPLLTLLAVNPPPLELPQDISELKNQLTTVFHRVRNWSAVA